MNSSYAPVLRNDLRSVTAYRMERSSNLCQTSKIYTITKSALIIMVKGRKRQCKQNDLFIVSESPLHCAHFYLGLITVSLQTKKLAIFKST